MTPLEIILISLALINITGFVVFGIISLQEKHQRAARISTLLALLTGLLFTALLLAPPPVQRIFLIVLLLASGGLLIWLIWPAQQAVAPSPPPATQVDERTILFARARLTPGTPHYSSYYTDHPEHQAPDDAFRQNPGLLSPGTAFYDPLLASSPEGGFFLTEALRNAVDSPVGMQKTVNDPNTLTHFMKNIAFYHGAHRVGVCELQHYHCYSHIGRGTGEYGAPITLPHRYAIAITVEMAHAMINSAPRMPAVMESARQYAESGKIAVILAAAIRGLGYPARAHIDGNYRVIAPLVAKDAGLGEIGRMGILMTPRLGPRVRLAVVTTDLPLITNSPTWNPAMINFCANCSKCATTCPSGAIPLGERVKYDDGTLRWKINAERCYTYWTKVGTDCGRCMAVCPYAHADNVFHNLIRDGVRLSANFRRAAIRLDDVFYGKKPLPHSPPNWVQDV